MTLLNTLALAMGSSWISGIKRSASVATLGLLYLNSYETGVELSTDMTYWFNWYNESRKHTSLDKRTPNEAGSRKP